MAQPSTPERTGSCLCGAIQIRIKAGRQPFRTNLCHCLSCQKSSGVVFASLAAFNSDDVTYTTPEDPSLLRTYEDRSPESGSVLERSFCGRCGSNVRITRRPGMDFAVVPLGILDGDKTDLKPTLEFFCARRASWLTDIEGAVRIDKQPIHNAVAIDETT